MQMTAKSVLSYEETEKAKRERERERQRGRVINQLFDYILEETRGENVSRDEQEESSQLSLNVHVMPCLPPAHVLL